ncbi:MAG: hypothetical protein HYX35_03695 [Proteobacteria bacterium]|nr:hypothetical protein [Pseudomonadota bacterium]
MVDQEPRGRFFYDCYEGTYAEEVEKRWGPVVDLGEAKVSFELAKMRACTDNPKAQKRAAYWFLRYKELAPSLPFGDDFLGLS